MGERRLGGEVGERPLSGEVGKRHLGGEVGKRRLGGGWVKVGKRRLGGEVGKRCLINAQVMSKYAALSKHCHSLIWLVSAQIALKAC